MERNVEKLYKELCSIEINDRFAICDREKTVFFTPTELLIGRQEKRFLELMSAPGELSCEKMSDYELFSSFISKLSYMRGSAVAEAFFEKAYGVFGDELSLFDAPAEVLWRYYSEKLVENGGDPTKLCADVASVKDAPRFPIIKKDAESYDELIKINIDALSLVDKVAVADISRISFVRSDKYHCDSAYKEYLMSGDLDVDLVSCGLMYFVCKSLRERNICLWLDIGNNFASAEKMIRYLSSLGVLPDIRIFGDERSETRVAAELCRNYTFSSGESKALCGMVCRAGEPSSDIACRIKRIASVYPIGFLRFGGAVTDEPLPFAYRRIFLRGLSSALWDICQDHDSALSLAREILCSDV